jgi:hypothetical protein
MQKKIIGGLVVFLIGILIFASCAKDTVVYPPSNIIPGVTYSFKDTIQPIFNAGCLGSNCHGGTVNPNLSAGQSYNNLISGHYVNTGSPSTSEIYVVMAPGGLMASHCTPAEADLVLAWITQGAKDN